MTDQEKDILSRMAENWIQLKKSQLESLAEIYPDPTEQLKVRKNILLDIVCARSIARKPKTIAPQVCNQDTHLFIEISAAEVWPKEVNEILNQREKILLALAWADPEVQGALEDGSTLVAVLCNRDRDTEYDRFICVNDCGDAFGDIPFWHAGSLPLPTPRMSADPMSNPVALFGCDGYAESALIIHQAIQGNHDHLLAFLLSRATS